MLPISRRLALKSAFAAAAAGFLQPWRGTAMAQTGPMPGDPFSLGVASGDPTPDGFVLWTRLAPLPLEPLGGLGEQPVAVTLEVA
ncbi:MAG TPA: alkaline phosphatase, partial [Alphaproteobacteria bacterium]|nr:alkaline phosphatase [Alphaproteobacteria bacterium]